MSELSFPLKTLEPLRGALDIIRYLGTLDDPVASSDELCDELDLTSRGFSKAIRRLVTKEYVQMSGDHAYRLTELGQTAAEELAQYDASAPQTDETGDSRFTRRLIVAVPQTLAAGKEANLYIGFDVANDGESLIAPASMVLRTSAINGELQGEEMLQLSDEAAHQTFSVKAESYTKMRVKVEIYQLNPNDDGIETCGGLYFDVDVATSGDASNYLAYGTDVKILPVD